MNPHYAQGLTLGQKIMIGLVVGALIGAISAVAQDRLSCHYIKENGKKLKG
jgi:uncharacterized membrane protein